MRAEPVTDPVAEHGEGPCWWGPWGALRYVDMLAGDVLTLTPDGALSRTHVGAVAAALRPRDHGGAVVALERGFAVAGRDDLADLRPLGTVFSDPALRFNDGGCDPDGRFYCGTMAYDETPGAGAMYRLTPRPGGRHDVDLVWGQVTISNGFAFSPDGTVAYYNDTPTRRTDVFSYHPEQGLSGRRPLMRLPDDVAGNPDGLCVDAEGGVWVALWGGSAVHRYTPFGVLDGVVELPVSHVTACCFGGEDLATLYITTSRTGVAPGSEPEAGALFAVRPGVAGQQPLPFFG